MSLEVGGELFQTILAGIILSGVGVVHVTHVVVNLYVGYRQYGRLFGAGGLRGACIGVGDSTVEENREPLHTKVGLLVSFCLLAVAITLNALFFSSWPQIHFQPDGPNAFWSYLSWLGLLGCLLVLVAFSVVHWTMGREWAGQVVVKKDAQLVSSGIFSLARHPMYAAILWLPLFWLLATGGWLVALAILLAVLCTAARAPTEERILIRAFGPQYLDYMRRVGPFYPFSYELWQHDPTILVEAASQQLDLSENEEAEQE